MELGFAGSDPLIYECLSVSNNFPIPTYHAITPTPYVSFAIPLLPEKNNENSRLLNALSSCMVETSHNDKILLFREDSFDPVTRIRRGRFYKRLPNSRSCKIAPKGAPGSIISSTLAIYDSYYNKFNTKQLIAIGSEDSVWRVIATDRLSTGEFLVTLKSRNVFGVIPEVEEYELPEIHKEKIISELDYFVDAANRETPGSIVDAARRTAVVLISSHLSPENKEPNIFQKDLGPLSAELKKIKELSGVAAEVINKLHPRNKPNEQERHKSRDISEEDAELAVSLIGLLLQEFDWAR